MQNLTTKTLREIALEIPVSTRVFEEYKIDYCCGGQKMFLEACHTVQADPEIVLKDIGNVIASDENKEFEWLAETSLSDLIAHILEKHHIFTKAEILNLMPLMSKVADRHGERHFELWALEKVFNQLCRELSGHLLKEEEVLFPYLERLEASLSRPDSIFNPCFGTVQNPLRVMMAEHDEAGELLRKMREITNDYSLPADACPSFTALFARLELLEKDLHQHIHLENNLLFPLAVELEKRFFGTN